MTTVKHEPSAEPSRRTMAPASLHRQSGPGQGYGDKIRTFLAHIVPGSSRWRMVAAGALANRPMMHCSWPTKETVCSALADYSICVTREAKISLCVHAAFVLPHVHTHSFVLMKRGGLTINYELLTRPFFYPCS